MKKTIFYFIYGLFSIPVTCLILFIATYKTLEMLFFMIFILSLIPLGLVTMVLSIIALIKSRKIKNNLYIGLSLASFLLSGVLISGGLIGILGMLLVYVATA